MIFFKINQLEGSRLVEAMYNSYYSLTLPSYWCLLLTPRVGRPHSATSSPSYPLVSLVIICLLWSPGHSLPGMCSWQLGSDPIFIVFPQVVRELGPMFLNSQYEAQGPTLTSVYVCWLGYPMISWLAHLPCPSLCVFHSHPLPLHIDHSWWFSYGTDERDDFTWDTWNMFPYSEGREGPALTSLHCQTGSWGPGGVRVGPVLLKTGVSVLEGECSLADRLEARIRISTGLPGLRLPLPNVFLFP